MVFVLYGIDVTFMLLNMQFLYYHLLSIDYYYNFHLISFGLYDGDIKQLKFIRCTSSHACLNDKMSINYVAFSISFLLFLCDCIYATI